MKKKEYISPEAEVFVCKTNALLMASAKELDELLTDDTVNIIPDDTPVNEFFSHDSGFDFGDDSFSF